MHKLRKKADLKIFYWVEAMRTLGLHNSLPRVKVGFTSPVVLKIYPVECWGQLLRVFSQERLDDLPCFFHFLFTWFCCPNNHSFGKQFSGNLSVFSYILGSCLAVFSWSRSVISKNGEIRKWHAMDPSLSLNILLIEAVLIIPSFWR